MPQRGSAEQVTVTHLREHLDDLIRYNRILVANAEHTRRDTAWLIRCIRTNTVRYQASYALWAIRFERMLATRQTVGTDRRFRLAKAWSSVQAELR